VAPCLSLRTTQAKGKGKGDEGEAEEGWPRGLEPGTARARPGSSFVFDVAPAAATPAPAAADERWVRALVSSL
jgi:hypothetical protein